MARREGVSKQSNSAFAFAALKKIGDTCCSSRHLSSVAGLLSMIIQGSYVMGLFGRRLTLS